MIVCAAIKLIRENPEKIKAAMKTRNKDMDALVDEILEIDKQVRELTQKADALKAEQNAASKQIPQIKKEGGDISEIMARMNAIKEEVKTLASSFITIMGILMPLDAYTHATYFTLRSGGKTLITFIFDSGYMFEIVEDDIQSPQFIAHLTGRC